MKSPNEKKRISSTEITTGEPILLTSGHRDSFFLRPGQAIEVGSPQLTIKSYGISGFSTGKTGEDSDGNSEFSDGQLGKKMPLPPGFISDVVHKWGPKSLAYPIVLPDTPDLSDIESITYTKYYNSANVLKVKAVIKVRNSGKEKTKVVGVDARVFNVGG